MESRGSVLTSMTCYLHKEDPCSQKEQNVNSLVRFLRHPLTPRVISSGLCRSGCGVRDGGDKQDIQEFSGSPGPNLDSLCSRICLAAAARIGSGDPVANQTPARPTGNASALLVIYIRYPRSRHLHLPPGLPRLLPTDFPTSAWMVAPWFPSPL